MHIYSLGPKLLQWNCFQILQLPIRSGAHTLFLWFLDFSQFLTLISRKLWRHLATYMQWRLSPLGAMAKFPRPHLNSHAFLPPLPSVMPSTFSFPSPLLVSTPALSPFSLAPSPVESGHMNTTPEKFSYFRCSYVHFNVHCLCWKQSLCIM